MNHQPLKKLPLKINRSFQNLNFNVFRRIITYTVKLIHLKNVIFIILTIKHYFAISVYLRIQLETSIYIKSNHYKNVFPIFYNNSKNFFKKLKLINSWLIISLEILKFDRKLYKLVLKVRFEGLIFSLPPFWLRHRKLKPKRFKMPLTNFQF